MKKYAIIKSGGKQIKVFAGEFIWVEKLEGSSNDKITLDQVLALFDGKELMIGKPLLKAHVVGKVIKQGKGPKIRILRFKNKSNWERRQGHRQPYTKILIEEILFDGKHVDKHEPKKEVKHDHKEHDLHKDVKHHEKHSDVKKHIEHKTHDHKEHDLEKEVKHHTHDHESLKPEVIHKKDNHTHKEIHIDVKEEIIIKDKDGNELDLKKEEIIDIKE